jgi:hypothetical protein
VKAYVTEVLATEDDRRVGKQLLGKGVETVAMKSMNVALMWVGLVAAGCGSKTNPNVCCTDSANCVAEGLPDDAMCTDGLICRGNQCVAETCSSAAECEAGAPFCTSAGLCAMTCDSDTECPGFGGNASDTFCVDGACVACRTDADCPASASVCDAHVCRACRLDSECASSVCGDDGTCIASDAVVYLDSAGNDSGGCSQASPCRSMVYALTKAAPGRSTFSAATGLYQGPSDLFSSNTTAQTIDVHGHGSTFSQPNGNDGAALNIQGFQTVTFRDATFTVGGTGTAFSADGMTRLVSVTATHAPTCISVQGLDGRDLHITNCGLGLSTYNAATIDGVEISGGTKGAEINGVVAIKNMLIHDTSALAVEFMSGATGTVSFSTFAYSGAPNGTGARAIVCDTGQITLASSIIWAPGVATQVPVSSCGLTSTIAGPTAVTGASSSDPEFVDVTNKNYHLQSTSPAIDLVPVGPPTDLEGTLRPQGAKFDIGAYEYKP